MTKVNFSEWMSVGQAAESLGLAEGTIRTMLATGKLDRQKSPFGGTMICRTSVEEYRRNRLGRRGRPPTAEKS